MRLVLSLLAVLALAGYRGGCDSMPYDPCAGKACGEGCRLCDPDDADCVETAVVKACDPSGACVAMVPDLCGRPEPVPGTCDGKVCGETCWLEPPCRSAIPPCMMPSQAGVCDGGGGCWPAETPPDCAAPPSWGCEGKVCGDSCGYCPPGTDPAYCPVPTFAPTACDRLGNCVTATSWLCFEPCAGKACGDPCDACPPGEPCPMAAVVTACNTTGACVPMTSGMCEDPVTDCTGQACGMPCAYPCPPDTTCAPSRTPLACNGNQRCSEVRAYSCYVPCAGKACGEPCHVCPREPGFGCGELDVLKLCDANSICVMAGLEVVCR